MYFTLYMRQCASLILWCLQSSALTSYSLRLFSHSSTYRQSARDTSSTSFHRLVYFLVCIGRFHILCVCTTRFLDERGPNITWDADYEWPHKWPQMQHGSEAQARVFYSYSDQTLLGNTVRGLRLAYCMLLDCLPAYCVSSEALLPFHNWYTAEIGFHASKLVTNFGKACPGFANGVMDTGSIILRRQTVSANDMGDRW
jgi:hypothetical protein